MRLIVALIEWDDSLSVNVTEIDLQHQRLVAMINKLNDAMMQGNGKEVVNRIINGLMGYAGTHFKTEEKYFDKFGYPETVRHKREHAAFVEKVSEFKGGLDSGRLSLSIEVMRFMSDWLQTHIKESDKKYSKFFNEKGLR